MWGLWPKPKAKQKFTNKELETEMSTSKPEWKCETEEIGQSEKQYPRNTLYDSRSKTFKTVRRKIFKDRKGVLKETIDIETGVKRTIFGKIPNLALPKDWTLEELTDSNESVNSADLIDIALLSDHSKGPRASSPKKNDSRNSSSINASRSSSPKENQLNESSILRDSGLSPSEKIIGNEETPTIYSDDAEDLHALSSQNLTEEDTNKSDHSKEPHVTSSEKNASRNSSSKNASRCSSPKDNQLNESSILRDSRLSPTIEDEEIPKIYSDAEDLHALSSEKEPRAPPSSKNASRSSSPKDNQLNESSILRDSRLSQSEKTTGDEEIPKINSDDAEDLHALSSENLTEEESNKSDNSSPKKTRDSVGTKPQKCDENDYSGETGKSEIGDVDKVLEPVKKVLDNLFAKHKTMENRVKKVVADVYEKYHMRFHSRKEDRHVAFNDPSFHREVNESIQQNFTPCRYHQSLGQCVHIYFDRHLSINESLGQCGDQELDSRLSPTLPIQSRYGTRGKGNNGQNIDDQLIELLKLTEVPELLKLTDVPTIRCHYDPCFMEPMFQCSVDRANKNR